VHAETKALFLATVVALSGIRDGYHPTPPPKPPVASETMLRTSLNPLEPQKPSFADFISFYITRFKTKELPVRSEISFDNKIQIVTIPRSLLIGDADGTRPVIVPYDFPDLNFGRLMRPVLSTKPPLGPFKDFLLITNPETQEKMVWVAYWDKQLGRLVFFPIGQVGQPGNWYSTLHLNDGKIINGDEVFVPYIP